MKNNTDILNDICILSASILKSRLDIIDGLKKICEDGEIDLDVDILVKCNNDTENMIVSITQIEISDQGMLKFYALSESVDLVYFYQNNLSIENLIDIVHSIKDNKQLI